MKYDKVVVNSAWPYAYSIPHIGNVIACLLSGDVFARYYRLKGMDTIYVSGSDTHGTRIEYESMKKNTTPKKIAYDTHKKIKKLIDDWNINFDNYTHTDTKNHHDFVQKFYTRLNKKGFIITKTEKHPYCNNCEMFLADKFITGECPYCGSMDTKGNQCDSCGKIFEAADLKNPVCTICDKQKVVMKKTKHWYIDLKKLEPKIKKYVKSHTEWDKRVKKYTDTFLKTGLKPRPITRDIKWGIPAPFEDAEDKVFYVWTEAVLGYLSASKELLGDDYLDYWKKKNVKHIYCHAKDNVPFHTIILPALLIGDSKDWHLPDTISSIEFLNFNNKKFSKTHNVGIWMDEAVKMLPPEYWRFYLLLNRPETHDFNFTWKTFDNAINKILISNLCNFLNRTITFAKKYGINKTKLNKEDKNMLEKIEKTYEKVDKSFEQGSLRNALEEVVKLGKESNKYFQEREPWNNKELRNNTIIVSIELSKAIILLLYPFTPNISNKASKILNIDIKSFKQLKERLKPSHKIKKPETLVNKINTNELKKKYKKMKKNNKISYEDFKKIDLRIGKITKVSDIKDSDKLYKLKIKTDKNTKQVVAGIRKQYKKDELLNKQVVFVNNLETAKIMGIKSEGMLLAAVEKNNVVLLVPDKKIKNGSRIK